MTYLVTEECIKCKHMDCVEVCPVDCFYEGENFLAINPDECIDCGVCEPECPIDAIKADNDDSVEEKEKWLLLNKKFSAIWPNISKKKEPMKDHKKFENVKRGSKPCVENTAFLYSSLSFISVIRGALPDGASLIFIKFESSFQFISRAETGTDRLLAMSLNLSE